MSELALKRRDFVTLLGAALAARRQGLASQIPAGCEARAGFCPPTG